jgi:hypothetical protein
MNKEEYDTLCELREKYAVNISKGFKIFLKKYLDKFREHNIEPTA